MKNKHEAQEGGAPRPWDNLDYTDTVICSHWFTVLDHVDRGDYRRARDLLTSAGFLATMAGDITPPPPPAAERLKRMGHENAGHLLAHLNEQLEMESFDCPIDECQPWPEQPSNDARELRATIDNGMTYASDAAADVITAVANQLATAAGVDWRGENSPQWIEGAAYAFGTVFGRLLHEMPLAELRELIEDIADDVAPDRGGDQ